MTISFCKTSVGTIEKHAGNYCCVKQYSSFWQHIWRDEPISIAKALAKERCERVLFFGLLNHVYTELPQNTLYGSYSRWSYTWNLRRWAYRKYKGFYWWCAWSFSWYGWTSKPKNRGNALHLAKKKTRQKAHHHRKHIFTMRLSSHNFKS